MSEFLTGLGRSVEGSSTIVGLAAALVWGVISIVLSPCHLASIPLLVGYISRDPGITTTRAFRVSAAFAGGVLIAIAALGAVTIGAGRLAGDTGSIGGIILSVLMILFGLNLMEVFTIPVPALTMPGGRRSGLFGASLYGLVFGTAAGPCTFAFVAPLLGLVLAAQASDPARAAGLLGAFAVGHCGVIVLAGTFSGTACRLLNWNEKSKMLLNLRRIAGALVIVAGLYLLRRTA